ncbi:apolipoprotein N-acyltransferase, partial [Candidatus Sumerlaeota bacterium]|nr:apolipoprotein N-acyltransferase [Candidatus Sumerlaeota bacterium]
MMTIGGVRLGVSICYEDAFPGLNRRDVKAGAQLLLNLTNDAWYRGTSQLQQHLAIARFRAIETRRPLVRCTNS